MQGLNQTKFYSISNEFKQTKSVISKKHGLCGKRERDSNKYNAESHELINMAVQNLCEEFAIEPPWYINTSTERQPILLMPPSFSRNELYIRTKATIGSEQSFSRTGFYHALNSERFNSIRFSMKETGLCDYCAELRETTRGLLTMNDARSRAKLI